MLCNSISIAHYHHTNNNIVQPLTDTGTREDGTEATAAAALSSGLQKISNRAIMQARQEMPLVKLQLQRHKRGEKSDYVSAENYSDIAVSSKVS